MSKMSKRVGIGILVLAGLAVILGPQAQAGTIGLSWSPSATATGYTVYYGTDQNSLTSSFPVGGVTQTEVNGLSDCVNWYFAVSATNAAGESPLSTVVQSYPRPEIDSTSHVSATQGDVFTLQLTGANFVAGTQVTIDNPGIVIESVTFQPCVETSPGVVSPGSYSALVTVDDFPTRPAQIGSFNIEATNPDDIASASDFDVWIDPSRLNFGAATSRETGVSDSRIDQDELSQLGRRWGTCVAGGSTCDPSYDPTVDIDGDGWISGNDLAILAQAWGKCFEPDQDVPQSFEGAPPVGTRPGWWTEAGCPVSLR